MQRKKSTSSNSAPVGPERVLLCAQVKPAPTARNANPRTCASDGPSPATTDEAGFPPCACTGRLQLLGDNTRGAPGQLGVYSSKVRYIVGLGSNLGARVGLIRAALASLRQIAVVEAVSPIVRSEALRVTSEELPEYANAAARVEFAGAPSELLEELLRCERDLGRTREGSASARWESRTIDLDILWGERPVQTDRLTIPHPGLWERAFALQPACAVASDAMRRSDPRLAGVPETLERAPLPELVRQDRCIEVRGWDAADAICALLQDFAEPMEGEVPRWNHTFKVDDPAELLRTWYFANVAVFEVGDFVHGVLGGARPARRSIQLGRRAIQEVRWQAGSASVELVIAG